VGGGFDHAAVVVRGLNERTDFARSVVDVIDDDDDDDDDEVDVSI
jgi:hypothetical protein